MMMSFQNPSGQFDSMKFPTLENQLLDIMKHKPLEAEGVQMHGDNMKGNLKNCFCVCVLTVLTYFIAVFQHGLFPMESVIYIKKKGQNYIHGAT